MIKRHTKFIKKVMKDQPFNNRKKKPSNQLPIKIKNSKKTLITKQSLKKFSKRKKEETDNQKKTGQKGAPSMTRYQHIVAIMSLMPDDLKDTIADMVQASCPELDLVRVDEMKQVIEEQPVNFIDQLIKELHDVCDMFGLIDPTKITTVNIEGVDVDFYAADWHQGQKVEW